MRITERPPTWRYLKLFHEGRAVIEFKCCGAVHFRVLSIGYITGCIRGEWKWRKNGGRFPAVICGRCHKRHRIEQFAIGPRGFTSWPPSWRDMNTLYHYTTVCDMTTELAKATA